MGVVTCSSMGFDVDIAIAKLRRYELLSEAECAWLCDAVKEQLITESNVVELATPVSIVGDIHGQFDDLLEIFRVGGECPDTNYLCLGDFVDRGHDSVQTISLLVCYKLKHPRRLTLLRGNHECRAITQVYGFYAECYRKYGSVTVWGYFTALFDYLPIAALVDNRFMCVHGGLSPSAHKLDQIRAVFRFKEVPHDGLMTDLLWSDPSNSQDGFSTSSRGAGYIFGGDVVAQFLWTNQIDGIVRGHQLCMEGFQTLFDKQVVTVWSAPNYCYRCGNVASILELGYSNDDIGPWHFNQFMAVPDCERHSTQKQNVSSPDYFL